ncbi:hypothetical protein RIF29_03798 [Crotalaria pallida]|uniref:Uncharacterized protein n=1 Tax=Crotalaria pallida TaxID=3830 RepID=A0AAN9J0B6_CROPI
MIILGNIVSSAYTAMQMNKVIEDKELFNSLWSSYAPSKMSERTGMEIDEEWPTYKSESLGGGKSYLKTEKYCREYKPTVLWIDFYGELDSLPLNHFPSWWILYWLLSTPLARTNTSFCYHKFLLSLPLSTHFNTCTGDLFYNQLLLISSHKQKKMVVHA